MNASRLKLCCSIPVFSSLNLQAKSPSPRCCVVSVGLFIEFVPFSCSDDHLSINVLCVNAKRLAAKRPGASSSFELVACVGT